MHRFVSNVMTGVLASCLIFLFISKQVVGQTIVPFPIINPGFEDSFASMTECANITGQVANGWTDNTCWNERRPVIRYARDPVNPHSGLTSQKITLVKGNFVQFAQFLSTPLQSSTRYSVSLWMRSAVPMFVTLYLRQAGPPYSGYTSKLIKLSSTWTKYALDGATNGEDGVLLVVAESPGTFWLDDANVQSQSLAALTPPPPRTAIPRGYFGMHFNRLDTPWPRIGDSIGAVRIWDAGERRDGTGVGAQWSEINAVPGNYDWSGLDARVASALAQRSDLIYTLGGRTPRWASALPNAISPYGPGQCAVPKNNAIWQEWIRTIATRYKGKIKFWEVWNEPDISDFYCGSPDKLIDLARQVNNIVKQIDPTNRVLSPGFSGYQGPGYLDYFLAHGGNKYTDIISYHFYVDKPEDNAEWRLANLQLAIRRNNATTKPLWNTEQGWIEIPNPTPIPQPIAAAYVARTYLLHWAYGVKRFYYYTWDNEWNRFQFGQPDNIALTPSGIAYREVAGWMTGKVMESLTIDVNETYIVTLRDVGGKKQRVIWNPQQNLQLAIPVGWGVNWQRNLAGATTNLTGKTSLLVTASPILLERRQP